MACKRPNNGAERQTQTEITAILVLLLVPVISRFLETIKNLQIVYLSFNRTLRHKRWSKNENPCYCSIVTMSNHQVILDLWCHDNLEITTNYISGLWLVFRLIDANAGDRASELPNQWQAELYRHQCYRIFDKVIQCIIAIMTRDSPCTQSQT